MTGRDPRRSGGMGEYDPAYAADRAAHFLTLARDDYDLAIATAKMTGDRTLWAKAAQHARTVVERERILRDRRREAGQDDLIDGAPVPSTNEELSDLEHELLAHMMRVQATADYRFAVSDAVDDVSAPAVAIMLASLTGHPEDVVLQHLAGAAVGEELTVTEAPGPVDGGPAPDATLTYYVVRRTR